MTDPPPPPDQDVSAQLQVISAQLDSAIEYLHDLRTSTESRDYRTKIIDFNMPFLALIGLLVKIALASIPAMILLAVVFGITGLLITALLAGTVVMAPLLAPEPVVAPIASTPRSSIVLPTLAPVPVVVTNLVLTAIDSQTSEGIQTVTGVIANRGPDASPAMTAVVVFQADGRSPVQQRVVLDPIQPGQSAEFIVTHTLPGNWSYRLELEDYIGRPISFRDLAE